MYSVFNGGHVYVLGGGMNIKTLENKPTPLWNLLAPSPMHVRIMGRLWYPEEKDNSQGAA